MSNLGFVQAMEAAGVRVVQTQVGDRYVLEAMRAGGYTLGGEQSGHVIMSRHATTGDGILTALHVLERMVVTGKDLQPLASVVTRLPQVLVNVPGVDKDRTDDPVLAAAVAAEEAALAGHGRVLLRPSGTEPVVRVMVEAPTDEAARAVAAPAGRRGPRAALARLNRGASSGQSTLATREHRDRGTSRRARSAPTGRSGATRSRPALQHLPGLAGSLDVPAHGPHRRARRTARRLARRPDGRRRRADGTDRSRTPTPAWVDVAVAPDQRRRGVGTALLAALEDRARAPTAARVAARRGVRAAGRGERRRPCSRPATASTSRSRTA